MRSGGLKSGLCWEWISVIKSETRRNTQDTLCQKWVRMFQFSSASVEKLIRKEEVRKRISVRKWRKKRQRDTKSDERMCKTHTHTHPKRVELNKSGITKPLDSMSKCVCGKVLCFQTSRSAAHVKTSAKKKVVKRKRNQVLPFWCQKSFKRPTNRKRDWRSGGCPSNNNKL